jgi:hypothetical protein
MLLSSEGVKGQALSACPSEPSPPKVKLAVRERT